MILSQNPLTILQCTHDNYKGFVPKDILTSNPRLACPLGCAEPMARFSRVSDPNLGKVSYFDCPKCGIILMDPTKRLSAQHEKERYDLHNNNPNDQRYREFLNQLLDPLKSCVKAGATGLDYGCGPGPTVSKILKGQGLDVKNYDPYFYPDETLLDGQYGFITATEVLEHVYSPLTTLKILNRMLKNSGVLGVMTLLYEDSQVFEDWWYQKDPTHVIFYRAKTMQYIAKLFEWECSILKENVIIFKK